MARGEWGYYNGRTKWCSYRRTTLIICSINIGVALYVLHTLYTSLYTYPFNDPQKAARYTPDQIRKMEESNDIRKASQPTELIKLVNEIRKDFLREEKRVDLPSDLKQQVIDEIVELLRSLKSSNATVQNEAVERWRKQKIREARGVARGDILNPNILPKDAKILAKTLKSRWDEFREEIGLWIPVAIINKEHDDKPEGEEEFDSQIIAGRQLPPECHTELHTDYGGAAVRWGLTHHKESAFDCCQACLDQAKNAKEGEKRCNIWVYCPSEGGCYSPDIYEHKHQECWLKYDEKPQVSFKDTYSESYRNSHPNVPLVVPWVAGIVSV
ncbi:Fanconi anemia group G protein [Heracleum sosnowskyi]|uniref:Fanconi anemia group G protein n=1 Tax=Heracleum sosnowskyi TaxID=360622 RepID=A0AAD8J3U1_9APIA|nr:Fanconi anemia group G protein [Heracleum sosnowskyi]